MRVVPSAVNESPRFARLPSVRLAAQINERAPISHGLSIADPRWVGFDGCPFYERRKTMNAYLKTLCVAAAVVGLYVPATAFAQKSAGGVIGEARLHPGTWGSQRTSRSYARSRPMVRRTAPVIVRSEPAPVAIAQSPTEQRSFSYEPSQRSQARTYSYEPSVQSPPIGGSGCGGTVVTEPAPVTAERTMRTERSFSYEPAIEPATEPAVRTYSAPRMRSRSSQSSRRPAYLLPKTDPNKYRGF